MSLNSGEVKRVLMGSLAGPESPNPWSQRTKLRAMEVGFGAGGFGRERKSKKMVVTEVSVTSTIGFVTDTGWVIDTIIFPANGGGRV